MPKQPIRFVELSILALWFGVLFGVLEGILLLVLYTFSNLSMWKNGVGPEILWVGPIVNAALFVAGGCALAVLFRVLGPRARKWVYPMSVALFAGVTVFGLLMSPRVLTLWGCAIGAAGVTVQIYRCAGTRLPVGFFRRTILAVVLVAVSLGGMSVAWVHLRERWFLASLPAPKQGLPNVLIIVLDGLRADHLSSYGYGRATSPNIDRMASEGVLFQKGFATSHWSFPSHAAILTGEMESNWLRENTSSNHQPPLPVTMSRNGYASAIASANNMWFTPKVGFGRGVARFDVYFHTIGDRVGRTVFGKMLVTGIRCWGGYFDRPDRKRAPLVNREALQWIDRSRSVGRPFMMVLNYMDVHEPYFPPPPFRNLFSPRVTRANMMELHPNCSLRSNLTEDDAQLLIDAYDSSLAYLDHWLGELRKELEQRQLFDRTVIIVTADHGEELGEQKRFGHTTPVLRQEITRVPLIVRYPFRVPQGVRVPHAVSLRQIPATVTDLAYVHSDSPYRQRSLLTSLNGLAEPVYMRAVRARAVAYRHWHFILNKEKASLYDLDNDPKETTNLVGRPELAETEKMLRAQLQSLTQGAPALANDKIVGEE